MTLTKLSLFFLLWACVFATNPTDPKKVIKPVKQRKMGYKDIALNIYHQRVPTDFPEADTDPKIKGVPQEIVTNQFLQILYSCKNNFECYLTRMIKLYNLIKDKPLYAKDVFNKLRLSENGKEVAARLLNYAPPGFFRSTDIDASVLCLYSNLLAMAEHKNVFGGAIAELYHLYFAPGGKHKCRNDLRRELKIAERKVYSFSLRKVDIPYYRMNFKQLPNKTTVTMDKYIEMSKELFNKLSMDDAYAILSHPLLYYTVPPPLIRSWIIGRSHEASFVGKVSPLNIGEWFFFGRENFNNFVPEIINMIYSERRSNLFNNYQFKMYIRWLRKHRARQTEKYKDETCPINLIENHYNSLEYGTIANEDLVNLCKAQKYCDQEKHFYNLVHTRSVRVKDAFSKMCPEKSKLNIDHFAAFKDALFAQTIPSAEIINTVKSYPEFSTMLFAKMLPVEYLQEVLRDNISLEELLEINKYTFFLHENLPNLKKAVESLYSPFDQGTISPKDLALLKKFINHDAISSPEVL